MDRLRLRPSIVVFVFGDLMVLNLKVPVSLTRSMPSHLVTPGDLQSPVVAKLVPMAEL